MSEAMMPQADCVPVETPLYEVEQNILIRGLPSCDESKLPSCELMKIVHRYKKLLSFGGQDRKRESYASMLTAKRNQYFKEWKRVNPQDSEDNAEEAALRPKLDWRDPDWEFLDYLRAKEKTRAAVTAADMIVLPDGVHFVMPITYGVKVVPDGLLLHVFCNPAEKAVERLPTEEFRVLPMSEMDVWLRQFCDALKCDLNVYLNEARAKANETGTAPDYFGYSVEEERNKFTGKSE